MEFFLVELLVLLKENKSQKLIPGWTHKRVILAKLFWRQHSQPRRELNLRNSPFENDPPFQITNYIKSNTNLIRG